MKLFTLPLLLFFIVTSAPFYAAELSHEPPSSNNLADYSDIVITPEDSEYDLIRDAEEYRLQVTFGTSSRWPGIHFSPIRKDKLSGQAVFQDLTSYESISLKVQNLEQYSVKVYLRVDSPFLTNLNISPRITQSVTIPAGKSKSLSIRLERGNLQSPKLVGMHSLPQGLNSKGINPSKISNVLIFIDRPAIPVNLKISNIAVQENYRQRDWESLSSTQFFPFIDRYGQFKHASWPGKINAQSDLIKQKIKEDRQLDSVTDDDNIDQYGGWEKGKKFSATDHFQVKKIKGTWWFIDPDGYRFWSHGLDVIKLQDQFTITSEREHYFSDLPNKSSPLYSHLQTIDSSKTFIPYYQAKGMLNAYNFATSNLQLKYGGDWENIYPERIYQRLKNWGFNTMGLWSDPKWTSTKKVPYVEWMYYWSPKIRGKTSRWKRMVDMWDPKFTQALANASGIIRRLKDDPWLIGLFVDNELSWQDAQSFMNEVLSSSNKQAAKSQLIDFLSKKYNEINRLNDAWNTKYSTWNSMSMSTGFVVSNSAFREDSEAFYRLSVARYYRSVRDTIKNNAPQMLYLCSRFAGSKNDIVVNTAADYCDVLSFNYYAESTNSLSLPPGLDKPILIGEWHFGADDRGVFGRGLSQALDQEDRALKYLAYAKSAVLNPNIIGIHWFQYMDEITTGRLLDGENHQVGLVSITDTPYSETIRASQKIGRNIYPLRTLNK